MKKSLNIPYWFVCFLMMAFLVIAFLRIALVAGPTFPGLFVWLLGGFVFAWFLGLVAISASLKEKNDD